MGLKAIYESLDEVPEALRDNYTEDKGKFVLVIDDFEAHPKVRGLVTANKANVTKRDEYKTRAAELEAKLAELPEDFDAEKWVALNASVNKDDPTKRDADLQSMKQVYEGKIANLQKKYETDIAAKNAEVAERDGYIDSTVVVGGLKDSLLAAGANADPEMLGAAVDRLRKAVKVQRTEDGSRKAFVETDLGEVGVTDFVKDWIQTKGRAFLAPVKGDAPDGNDSQRRGLKTTGGDMGGDKSARVKALASKFPELAASS